MGIKKRFQIKKKQRAKRHQRRKKLTAQGKKPDELYKSGIYIGDIPSR